MENILGKARLLISKSLLVYYDQNLSFFYTERRIDIFILFCRIRIWIINKMFFWEIIHFQKQTFKHFDLLWNFYFAIYYVTWQGTDTSYRRCCVEFYQILNLFPFVCCCMPFFFKTFWLQEGIYNSSYGWKLCDGCDKISCKLQCYGFIRQAIFVNQETLGIWTWILCFFWDIN